MRWKKRFELWKDWSAHSLNHPVYKFLVLIGLAHSPTFTEFRIVKEAFEQMPDWEYSFLEEKREGQTYERLKIKED